MRFGLIFSIALHALLIAMLVITIRSSLPLLPETPDIPVEVVDLAPEANVKAATKETKPDEVEPPAPAPAQAPAPATPPEATPDQTEPEAVAAPEPKKDEKPEDKPKPPTVKPQQKPTPPKTPDKAKDDKFDPSSIQRLIDKAKKDQEKEQKTAEERPADTKSDTPRQSVGAGNAMTMTLIQSLARQVRRCWNPPVGADQSEVPIVDIAIYLRPDGTLSEPPRVQNQARMSDTFYRAWAESAVRAINQCQPYDLPDDQYNVWKEIIWTFDPSKMLGISSN